MIVVLVGPPLLAGGYAMAVRFMEPQTLPPMSHGEVQPFDPRPNFVLSREAAAQKAFKADLEAQRGLPNSSAPAPIPPKD